MHFIVFSVLGIIFNVVNIALVIPMLNILFDYETDTSTSITKMPEFSFSLDFFIDTFNYYFTTIVREQGATDALLFICMSIIASVLLTNLLRYLERMVALRLKIEHVKNMRMALLRHVSRLNIGYFNNQRRGHEGKSGVIAKSY